MAINSDIPVLRLNQHQIPLDALRLGSPFPFATTAFEKATVDFCKGWLRGDTSFSIQTSGSTGTPKEITHTRMQMLASAQATISHLQLQATDTALVCIPTSFVGGRMMLVRALALGMPIIALEPKGNPLGRALAAKVPIGFVALVPLQMEQCLEHTPEFLPKLASTRAIILGGAPVSSQLEKALMAVPCPVYHTYGMTETVSHIALRRLNGPGPEKAFALLPGIEAELDERNCLRIKGEVTQGQWIQTNDVVSWKTERSFVWLGRADLVINSGGVKIFTESAEAHISKVWKTTERFFLFGLPDNQLGERLVLVVEGLPWPLAKQEEYLARFVKILPKYHAPKEFIFIPNFKETPTGKIQRKATLNLTDKKH
ncbi:MAG TPA: O-succinylbenzoic acid--CoA ligase [Cytophagales bacterium]|nr:O-succinylbenzoic acid--CoA ligase [Cytophagales bacterium]HAA22087.1 O-succinylbenzoic acid--CoA ligase [Cytophagales bacterium]HAP59505.1 O-succinylbenzoic acid--CoA ligase [Cytophagales bacterium]